MDMLERENRELKRSVFELSSKLSQMQLLLKSSRNYNVIENELDELMSNSSTSHNGDTIKVSTAPDSKQGLNLKERGFFKCDIILPEHTSSVYCCRWSPAGSMVASGSLDKKIMVRVIEKSILNQDSTDNQYDTMALSGHEQLVSSIQWSSESILVSGSFDGTVKSWDLTHVPILDTEKTETAPNFLHSYAVHGLVQSVAVDPDQSSILFCGTNLGLLWHIDTRTATCISSSTQCASINTVVTENSRHILTGDSNGVVKRWDSRDISQSIEEWKVESAGRPVTCISTTYGETSRKLLAVNSYDNILRVFPAFGSGAPLYNLLGHRNTHWPIQSSFFCGQFSNQSMDLLATGSASKVAFVFGVADVADVLYKIKGHSGRVYSCDFNTAEGMPVLATCSADSTVRIWSLQDREDME